MKKLISGVLAAALILLSPGLPAYEAFAANFTSRSSYGGPRAVNTARAAAPRTGVLPASFNIRPLGLPVAGSGAALTPAAASVIPQAIQPANAAQGSQGKVPSGPFQGIKTGDAARPWTDPKTDAFGLSRRTFDNSGKSDGSEPGSVPGKPSAGNQPLAEAKDQAPAAPEVPAPAAEKNPGSFKNFVLGGSLLAMANEGISIISSVYGIQKFGLPVGILSQGIELSFRIPGSIFGAKWISRFDAKKIYMTTTAVQGLLLLSLPLGAHFFGVASSAYLAHYFAIQVMRGLIYGATRGMAENQIMPRLVGSDRSELNKAGFLFMASSEIFALVTALGISPVVRKALGANASILVFGGIMLSSLLFFKRIKFSDEGPGGEEEKKGTEDALPLREYIPYVASSFLHFAFYSLFGGVLAVKIFNNEFMSDRVTGTYDLGSLALSLVASLGVFLVVMKASPRFASAVRKIAGLLEKPSLKAWFGVAVLAGTAYLWTSFAGMTAASLTTAAFLGALTTVNRTKWMSSYLNRLKPEHHARVISRLNSVSVLATLLPFAAIGFGVTAGLPLTGLLAATFGAITAGLAASWVLARQPETKKDS